MAELKRIVDVSSKTITIAICSGYDEETGYVREFNVETNELKEFLKGLREDNKYDIEITEILMKEILDKPKSKSKKTAKAYKIPVYTLYQCSTEYEVRSYGVRVSDIMHTRYAYIGFKKQRESWRITTLCGRALCKRRSRALLLRQTRKSLWNKLNESMLRRLCKCRTNENTQMFI